MIVSLCCVCHKKEEWCVSAVEKALHRSEP